MFDNWVLTLLDLLARNGARIFTSGLPALTLSISRTSNFMTYIDFPVGLVRLNLVRLVHSTLEKGSS